MENTVETTTITPELPLVALIGPTNAGKSTLFNRLTGSWQAVTAKEESTTRDRVYGEVDWQGHQFTLVDTGGLADNESELYQLIQKQTLSAIDEADLLLFIYDAAAGLDEKQLQFLNKLRGEKPLWLIANKVDSIDRVKKISRYDYLGLPYHEVSAVSGRGSGDLLEEIVYAIPKVTLPKPKHPVIALIGRPNVGKSTLLNALTDSDRAVVSPVAGTTRDIVIEELTIHNRKYLLADTAGVRRRGKITAGPEAFSVKRTLTAIANANLVLVVIDAAEGTTRGDLHLLYASVDQKKPTLIIFNKIDLLDENSRLKIHKHAGRFDTVAISAQSKENLDDVIDWIERNS